MKIIFWGTPSYAIPTLEALVNSKHEVLAVVTQPDRKRARGNKLLASPIKNKAIEHGIEIFTPYSIKKDTEIQKKLAALNADLYVVVAFGQILPKEILSQPPLGCWNSHASILPRWRGAAPIQWSIINGDKKTGVAIMSMEETLDTGPVLMQQEINIDLLENASELSERLSKLSSKLMIEAINKLEKISPNKPIDEQLNLEPQCDMSSKICYARQLIKADLLVDWGEEAIKIHQRVMGLFPYCYTLIKGKRFKLLETEPISSSFINELPTTSSKILSSLDNATTNPGRIHLILKDLGIIVGTGKDFILIKSGQLEGKSPSSCGSLVQQLNTKVDELIGN